jgi:hypothetical protein
VPAGQLSQGLEPHRDVADILVLWKTESDAIQKEYDSFLLKWITQRERDQSRK